MRVFLLGLRDGGEWGIDAEFLSYDKATNMARVRVKDGIEYDRMFLPNAPHNRELHRIVHFEEGENAKLPDVQA